MNGKGGSNGEFLKNKILALESLQTNSQVIAFYDKVANIYDEASTTGMQYNAPLAAAEEAGLLVPKEKRPLCRVLDVAAGTGLGGRELSKIGFRNLDALEPAEGMLKNLTDTGLYNNTYKEVIGVANTDRKVLEGVYDLVVVSGAVKEKHIEPSGVNQIIRFAKPGGLLLMTVNYDYVEFRKKVEAHMDQLEERGFVKKVSERVFPNYILGYKGVAYSFRVM